MPKKRTPIRAADRRVYRGSRLGCTKRLGGHFIALGVEVAVEGIHGRLEHQAAVGAAFKVTFDLGLDDR